MAKELPALKGFVKQLGELTSEEAHTYYRLTAQFGVKVYEAYLEWCEEVKTYLKKSE